MSQTKDKTSHPKANTLPDSANNHMPGFGKVWFQLPYLSEAEDLVSSEHHLNSLILSQNQTNIIILAVFHSYFKDFHLYL